MHKYTHRERKQMWQNVNYRIKVKVMGVHNIFYISL